MPKLMMDAERNQRDFDNVSEGCPWRIYSKSPFPGGDFSKCRPIEFKFRINGVMAKLQDCTQKNCPIMHFKKYFGGSKI